MSARPKNPNHKGVQLDPKQRAAVQREREALLDRKFDLAEEAALTARRKWEVTLRKVKAAEWGAERVGRRFIEVEDPLDPEAWYQLNARAALYRLDFSTSFK